MMKIFYFGRLSERVGTNEETLTLPVGITSVRDLKDWLTTHKGLGETLYDPSVKTMVNQTLVHDDIIITGTEEIGFLPPVGGG